MSELTDVLTGRANINRRTAFVLDKTIPGTTLSADRNPAKSSKLVVRVENASVSTGLVNIVGNVNESFSFSENGANVGGQDFTSINADGITMSGIVGGSISIEAVSDLGQPNNQEIRQYTNLPVRFYVKREASNVIVMRPQGQQQINKHKMIVGPTRDIKENDIVYALSGAQGLTRGVIDFAKMIYDLDGASHHIECIFKDI